MRHWANRSRADSKGPLSRRAPLASPRNLPNSRENSVTTLLVSLNSTTRRTIAEAFSAGTAEKERGARLIRTLGAELYQIVALAGAHLFAIGRIDVVVADEMERAMNDV